MWVRRRLYLCSQWDRENVARRGRCNGDCVNFVIGVVVGSEVCGKTWAVFEGEGERGRLKGCLCG